MKLVPFGDKIIRCEIVFDEIEFIFKEDDNLYYKIRDDIFEKIVYLDGVHEVNTMYSIIKINSEKLEALKEDVKNIVITTALKYINELIEDLENEYKEYKEDPDAWTENTGDFLETELEKINLIKEEVIK